MSAGTTTTSPSLIIVTGRPGSGKTTLAHTLARTIRCPVVSRDEIKEGLVNTIRSESIADDAIKWRVYDAFFATIGLLLGHDVTLVAEAAFQHARWATKLEPLLKIARTRIVICEIAPDLARARHVARGLADPQRERFHDDRAVSAAREGRELPLASYEAPHLDVPTLAVDTSEGCRPSIEEIVRFVQV